MYFKKLCLILLLSIFFTPSQSENIENLKVENEYSFYAGTFDTIDKEGDDKSKLFGIEHNNTGLFRDTFLGKFSPVSGGFVTGKNSVYSYTGVQAEYDLGFLKVIPSFAPGYYDAGNGKKLGSALEFRSEVKFNLDIFKNSKIGYSYGHISNNDWGDINPGVNNQQISFSKNF